MTNVCVSCPAPRRRRAPARRAPVRRRVRRRAPVRRRRVTRRAGAGFGLRARPRLTKFELAQINPFDKRALGVKIPDSNTQPSDTFIAEDRFTVTSAATDLAKAIAFAPLLSQTSFASTDSTSVAWTWGTYAASATASNYWTDATSNFVGVRPCGHGVKLSSPLAPTTATGFVHICLYPMSTANVTTPELPLNLSQMTSLPSYRRFTIASLTQKSVTIVNKFIDVTAQRYYDTDVLFSSSGNTTSLLSFQLGWCVIVVATEGAPLNTVSISAEQIVHYEALPKFSSTLTMSSSPAADFNVREMEGVSRIGGHSGSIIVEGEEQSAIARGYQALAHGAGAAAGEIYENYVLPAARGAGYAATYAAAGAAAGYGGGIMGVNTPRLMN